MKTIIKIIVFLLLPISLVAQNTIDKKAATMKIIKGFTDDYEKTADNKKYLSSNLKVFWPAGNVWPDGSGAGFEDFWEFYANFNKQSKNEFSNVNISELDNETNSFFTWTSTSRQWKEHPEWVGTTAEGPIAYRMVWENDQIVEWHIFMDSKSRQEQHANQAKEEMMGNNKLTATQIFEKVVNYYDPSGKWDSFSGSMHIQTFGINWASEEDLTIDNPKDYYRCIRYLPEGKFIKGVEKGGVFFSAMGEEFNPDQVPEKYQKSPYGLNEKDTRMMREGHITHFSLPLYLHAADAKPIDEVSIKTLFGVKCLAIKFEGLSDAEENSFLSKYPITLYIDPANDYRLHAYHVDNGWWKDGKGVLGLTSGEIEIGGIKIPAKKLYFEAANQNFQVCDVFTTETSIEEKKNY